MSTFLAEAIKSEELAFTKTENSMRVNRILKEYFKVNFEHVTSEMIITLLVGVV